MQTTQGYYGHVAYVEGVNSNGSVRVSEMNYGHGAGVVTSRTISANQAGSYISFINQMNQMTSIFSNMRVLAFCFI